MAKNKYVSPDKLSKKAKKELAAKHRRTWGTVNPCTRTFPDKTKFSKSERCKTKAALRGLGDENPSSLFLYKNCKESYIVN